MKARELEEYRNRVRNEMQQSEIERQKRIVNKMYSGFVDEFKNEVVGESDQVLKDYKSRMQREKMEELKRIHFRAKCER